MKAEQLIIRNHEESDLPEILNLWENYSEWGKPDEADFRKWINTPFGECNVLVAETVEKKIIGQILYTPTQIFMGGQIIPGLKISAPIIHRDYRSENIITIDSVITTLFLKGYHMVKMNGYEWIYTFPVSGWVKPLQALHRMGLMNWKLETFACLEIMVDETKKNQYELLELDYFPDEIQSVWEKFIRDHKDLSFISRDIEWLRYKWGGELKVGIYKNGLIVGYFVVKQKTGLIVDFLINDFTDSKDVFIKLNELYQNWLTKKDVPTKQKLKFMPNKFLATYLQTLKTNPVNYQFAFGLSSSVNDPALTETDTEKWYIFPND